MCFLKFLRFSNPHILSLTSLFFLFFIEPLIENVSSAFFIWYVPLTFLQSNLIVLLFAFWHSTHASQSKKDLSQTFIFFMERDGSSHMSV